MEKPTSWGGPVEFVEFVELVELIELIEFESFKFESVEFDGVFV